MKKKILSILVCGILLIGLTGCGNNQGDDNLQDNNTYTINIPELDTITSVSVDTLAQTNNVKDFSDLETIKEIYNIFYNRTTDEESISDNPQNPDVLYIVRFYDNENNYNEINIYTKDKKYYLEQSYNGIYEIEADDFNTIENYVK